MADRSARRYREITCPLDRVDALWATGLAVLTLATRLPFRTEMLFNWDSANFALALSCFDVTQHRPHPPGYLFFVGLAKALYLLGLDANTSLVLVATLLSAGAVAALYYLGRVAGGRACGAVAALLLTFGVSFWSAGEVALAYPALAMFSALVALFTYRSLVRGEDYALPATLAYAIGGGFRPDLLLLLGPLWLLGLWEQPRRKQASCFLMTTVGALLWLAPTAVFSGGLTAYGAALWAYLGADVVEKYSSTQIGFAGLVRNLRDTASYVFYALYATVLPLMIAAAWWVRRRRMLVSTEGLLLVIWMIPILLFYTVVHIGDPGYAFSLLPAVLLLTARPLGAWLERGRRSPSAWGAAGLLVLVLVTNTVVFLARPGMLTLPGLRANDASLRLRLEHIQSAYTPDSTFLLSYSAYKHLLFYLPQYQRSLWIDVYRPEEQEHPIPEGVQLLVLTDPETQPPPGSERVELAPAVAVSRVRVQPGQVVVTLGARVEVR